VILHTIRFARELLQCVFAFHCGPAQVVPMCDVNRCLLAAASNVPLRGARNTCGKPPFFRSCRAPDYASKAIHKVSLTAPLKKLPLFQIGAKRLTRTIGCGSGHAEAMTSRDAMACCLLSPRE
jgi:hypothetical protein